MYLEFATSGLHLKREKEKKEKRKREKDDDDEEKQSACFRLGPIKFRLH